MKTQRNALLLLLLFLGSFSLYSQSNTKPKVIVTTDMGADPDDEQSMVRFLVSCNEFEVLGLITATGCWKQTQSTSNMNNYMNPLLSAYESAYSNLIIHSSDFPTPAYLRSVTVLGNTAYGMSGVGSGKDSDGSNLIIDAVDAATSENPVWVQSWGGSNTLAQALWKVENTRSQAEVDEFVSKVCCYDILGQDDAGAWITVNFPNLLYIRATDVYRWQRSKTDSWWGSNVQNHGSMGDVYPNGLYAMEGDTPAFLHAQGRGLNNPTDTKQRGWGGQFISKRANIESMSKVAEISNENQWGTYYMYGNSLGPQEFRQAIENDFAARMDWSNTSNFSSANHHPVVTLNGDETRDIIKIYTTTAGETITLSAAGTTDPDNNSLSYNWSYYQTDGTYNSSISLSSSSSQSTSFTFPAGAIGEEIHIVLAVSDNGSPSLTSYRRAVIYGIQDPRVNPVVTIESPEAGSTYEIGDIVDIEVSATPRVGSIANIQFFIDGNPLSTDDSAPYTASYTATGGSHTITATATDTEGNPGSNQVYINVTIPQGPFGGTAWAVPGQIEFENFDTCGNGCAYYDDSPGTSVPDAPNYRPDEDVDIETCSDTDGGYNIGYGKAGEWLEYTVNVAATGMYDLVIRAACDGDGRTVSLSYEDGTSIASDIAIPNTGGWQTWEDVTVSDIELEAGEQVIRLTIGDADYVNLNYMSFSTDTPPVIPPTISITSPSNNDEFNSNQTISITADATATDATIVDVKFYAGTQLLYTDDSAPYSYEWSGMSAGTYQILAIATDSNNSEAEDEISVTVVEAPVSISLQAGWNLIGYPYIESADIASALSSIWNNVEIVKNDEAYYNTSQADFLNLLQTLEWGKGYLIKVSEDCELDW